MYEESLGRGNPCNAAAWSNVDGPIPRMIRGTPGEWWGRSSGLPCCFNPSVVDADVMAAGRVTGGAVGGLLREA